MLVTVGAKLVWVWFCHLSDVTQVYVPRPPDTQPLRPRGGVPAPTVLGEVFVSNDGQADCVGYVAHKQDRSWHVAQSSEQAREFDRKLAKHV